MENQPQVRKIPLDLIDAPRVAMRTTIDDEDMEELMSDMQRHGLIEPIVVRPIGERFELIAGHRRTRAARLLGWEIIEAKVIECDDDTAFALRLAENLQRRDVSVIDEASYVGEIILRTKKTPAQIAEMLHRSLPWVNDRLEVHEMPDYMKEHLHYRRISLGAALWLVLLKNENTRRYYTNWCGLNGCSVAYARRLVDLEAAAEKALAAGTPLSPTTMPAAERPQLVTRCSQCGQSAALEATELVSVHIGPCPRAEDVGKVLETPAPPIF